MITITINGQPVEVPAGTTVLQACRDNGVEIPTLCDHPSLKPYGGCRLCVVEVQGMRTLQASCTLPAFNGMTVQTDTPKVRKAREFILEMIFSERNHFCMYCQKSGGDCELQNAAYGEDMTHWPIQPNWTPYQVDASHPYFVFDHNRCILCRRCVRACGELVGNFTLNLENRGAKTLVVADFGLPMGESSCIKCGTCVQVCPTGALIDRNSAYMGLDCKADHIQSICVGCSVGCSVDLLVRDNQLIRIDGYWQAEVNEGLLCERGRYLSLPGSKERIKTPMIRKSGELVPASWGEAIQTVSDRLLAASATPEQGVAALASTRLSSEALYAFRQIFSEGLHSFAVASIEEAYVSASIPSGIAVADLSDLKVSDCVLTAGADLFESHKVAGYFIKRNIPLGTDLIVIDPGENSMMERASETLRIRENSDESLFKGLMAALIQLGLDRAEVPSGFNPADYPLSFTSEVSGISAETLTAVCSRLASAENPVFIFGKGLSSHGKEAALAALFDLARLTGAKVLTPRGKANSRSAIAYDLNHPFEPEGFQVAYLALGDDEPSERLMEELEGVPFLVVQGSYANPAANRADVVLPVGIWAEQSGHYVNLEGRLQQANLALQPAGQVRTNLQVLQELADCLGVVLDAQWEAPLAERQMQAVG